MSVVNHIFYFISENFCAQAWVGADSVTIFTPEIAGGTLQTRLSEQVSDCQVTLLGFRLKLLFSYFHKNLLAKIWGNYEKNHENIRKNLGEIVRNKNKC